MFESKKLSKFHVEFCGKLFFIDFLEKASIFRLIPKVSTNFHLKIEEKQPAREGYYTLVFARNCSQQSRNCGGSRAIAPFITRYCTLRLIAPQSITRYYTLHLFAPMVLRPIAPQVTRYYTLYLIAPYCTLEFLDLILI